MKKFCISLREHATKEINFEKKKMQPLSKKEHITAHCICGKRFPKTFAKDKNY